VTVNGWQAFCIGLRRALAHSGLLVIVLGLNLVSALALALLPAGMLAQALGQRPALRAAADGVDMGLVVDALTTSLVDATLAAESAAPELARMVPLLLLAGVLVSLALPVVAWLTTAFLSGGIVLTYAESADGLHCRRFLWGCWHWFGSFLLLGLVQAALSAVVILPIGLGLLTLGMATGWLWITLAPMALAIAAFGAVFELARVVAVVQGTRHIIRTLGGAVRLLVRQASPLWAVYGLAFAALAGLYALHNLAIVPWLPLQPWLLAAAAQQVIILLGIWIRLARIAGSTALTAARLRAGAPPLTEPATRLVPDDPHERVVILPGPNCASPHPGGCPE